MLVNLNQAVRRSVMTARQRSNMVAEFNHDALLRADLTERYASYQIGLNSGFMKPNEVRQLENLPPVPGGDQLMVQAQMIPITQVGQTTAPATTGAA